MTAPTIGDARVISGKLTEPLTGAWILDAVLDTTGAPTGQQTAVIDGQGFVGTVRRSSVENGKVNCRLVAGAGSLGADPDAGTVGAKAYHASVTLQTVLNDLLTANGETLDSTATSLSTTRVATWQRAKGPHRRALEALVTKAGLNWRVLRNGNLWVGEETWPEFTGKVNESDANVADGYFELRDAIAITPGVDYAGQHIRQVVHTLGKGGTITEAWIRPASGAIDQILERARREADYDRPWHCQVINQRADYSLELLPDDERIRGNGIDSVIIVPGLPGLRVEVPAGAGCYIEFTGGDPSLPHVSGWDHETSLTLLTIGAAGSAEFAARSDKVDSELADIKSEIDSIKTWLDAHVHPTGVGQSGTPSAPLYTNGYSPTTTACAKLKVE